MIDDNIWVATKEIAIAQISNSQPLMPCESTGEEIGEMIKAIYNSIESLIEEKK